MKLYSKYPVPAGPHEPDKRASAPDPVLELVIRSRAGLQAALRRQAEREHEPAAANQRPRLVRTLDDRSGADFRLDRRGASVDDRARYLQNVNAYEVTRPVIRYGWDTRGDHTFTVIADYPGGPIRKRFSYGNSDGKISPLTGTGTPTDEHDLAAWRALGDPKAAEAAEVRVRRIDAADADVIRAGEQVDEVLDAYDRPAGLNYFQLPGIRPSTVNSNSATQAVEDLARAGKPRVRPPTEPLRMTPGREQSRLIVDEIKIKPPKKVKRPLRVLDFPYF